MKKIAIHALLLVFTLSSLNAVAAEVDADRCQDDSYLEEAKELFNCEAGWFVDSCSNISGAAATLAGGMAGAHLVKPIRSRLNDEIQKRRFQQWSSLQDEFVKKDAADKRIIAQSNAIDKKWGRVFGNLEDAKSRASSEALRPSPEKLAQVQKEYEEAKSKPGFAEDEKRYRELKESRDRTSREYHEANKKLRDYETKLKSSSLTRTSGYFFLQSKLDLADDIAKGRDTSDSRATQKRMEEATRKTFLEDKGLKLKKGISVRGGWIGAGAGMTLAAIPWAINVANSKICKNLDGDKIRDYVTIASWKGADNCTVTLEDDKELEVLAKPVAQTKELFQKYPMLCQAFVKKAENRRAQLVKSSPEVFLTNCVQGKAEAAVNYNGHYYRFSVENAQGETKIFGPFGSGDQALKDPITLNWKFDPKTGEATRVLLDPATVAPRLDSGRGDLEYLRNVKNAVGSDLKPIPAQENNAAGVSKMTSAYEKDVLATMAEQSAAIKLALPQVMSSCGSMQDGSEDAPPAAAPAKSGS